MSESKQQLAPWPWRWDDTPWEKYDPMERAPWLVDAKDNPVLSGQISCKDEAHGRAIAAAPELVEALQAAMRAASDTLFVLREMLENDYEHTHPRLENLAEALDKATDVGYAALAKAGAIDQPRAAKPVAEPLRHPTICSFCLEPNCNGECSGDGWMGD
ncbi:hypothetical protein [Burkholderia gladioli]|uniref:hypothetical protein n=1 Tax=Burkholderia gladioli TaxID=28095 RepID=UPI0016419A56|nr:hypothetical protein [Burkholderia gladioli]